jgi:5-methylcytosine-specific restriction endonuclease McrA
VAKRSRREHEAARELRRKLRIFSRDGWVCQLCLAPIDPSLSGTYPAGATIDHIIPVSRGGRHGDENLQAAHRACNVSRLNRSILEWAMVRAGVPPTGHDSSAVGVFA